MTNEPSSPVVAFFSFLVAESMSVTLAPGTTASAGSFTVPVTRLLTVWPITEATAHRHTATAAAKIHLFMLAPPRPDCFQDFLLTQKGLAKNFARLGKSLEQKTCRRDVSFC